MLKAHRSRGANRRQGKSRGNRNGQRWAEVRSGGPGGSGRAPPSAGSGGGQGAQGHWVSLPDGSEMPAHMFALGVRIVPARIAHVHILPRACRRLWRLAWDWADDDAVLWACQERIALDLYTTDRKLRDRLPVLERFACIRAAGQRKGIIVKYCVADVLSDACLASAEKTEAAMAAALRDRGRVPSNAGEAEFCRERASLYRGGFHYLPVLYEFHEGLTACDREALAWVWGAYMKGLYGGWIGGIKVMAAGLGQDWQWLRRVLRKLARLGLLVRERRGGRQTSRYSPALQVTPAIWARCRARYGRLLAYWDRFREGAQGPGCEGAQGPGCEGAQGPTEQRSGAPEATSEKPTGVVSVPFPKRRGQAGREKSGGDSKRGGGRSPRYDARRRRANRGKPAKGKLSPAEVRRRAQDCKSKTDHVRLLRDCGIARGTARTLIEGYGLDRVHDVLRHVQDAVADVAAWIVAALREGWTFDGRRSRADGPRPAGGARGGSAGPAAGLDSTPSAPSNLRTGVALLLAIERAASEPALVEVLQRYGVSRERAIDRVRKHGLRDLRETAKRARCGLPTGANVLTALKLLKSALGG